MLVLPKGREQWAAFLGLMEGAIVGWLTHPLIWLCFLNPLKWLAYVAFTANSESGWDPNVVARERNGSISEGLLQFNDATARAGIIRSSARSKPFASGFAAARYVQTAITTDLRWVLWLNLPVLSAAWFRWLWTHGIEGAGGRLGEVWSAATTGEVATKRTIPGYLFYRGISLILGAWILYCWRGEVDPIAAAKEAADEVL